MWLSLAILGPYFPQSVLQNWSNRYIAFYKKWLKMSRCAETSIIFRNCQENFGLGFKNLEIHKQMLPNSQMAYIEVL